MTNLGCPWERTAQFPSPAEFEAFEKGLMEFVADGRVSIVPTNPSYDFGCVAGGRWFQWMATGVVWRLVPPDFPFTGLFEPVDYAAFRRWQAEFFPKSDLHD